MHACGAPSSPRAPRIHAQRTISSAPSRRRRSGNDAENYDEIRYEGRGPGGVAIIVEAMTDNRNRTSADVRSTFAKYGGAMAETGSVTFLFDHVGVIAYPRAARAARMQMLEAALEVGAEECISTDEGHEFLSTPENFLSVRDALEGRKARGAPIEAAITWRPPEYRGRSSDEAGESLVKLI